MDEMDLLLQRACRKVAEMEVKEWEKDNSEHIFSESFNQKMIETFPISAFVKNICQKLNKSPE